MNSFFATFPAGCYEIIARQLKGFALGELKITSHDDSSVIFDSKLKPERLIELRYFTNIYLLIEPNSPTSFFRGKYFSLAQFQEGQPTAMPERERLLTENSIRNDFGLIPDTHRSLNDFYVIERQFGGPRLLGLKLARAKFKRQTLAAGELRPELAHIICLVAGVKPNDRLLEVFAGSGALAFEAVRGFGLKQVVAIDQQKAAGRHESPAISWNVADARDLSTFQDGSFDRVLADPPWGDYQTMAEDEQQKLYKLSLSEMTRVLKPSGVLVVLSGSALLDSAVAGAAGLQLIKNYPILVSGKKARLFKLQKAGS